MGMAQKKCLPQIWDGGVSRSGPLSIRGFPTLGVPKNGWSMIGNPFKVDDLGVPPY